MPGLKLHTKPFSILSGFVLALLFLQTGQAQDEKVEGTADTTSIRIGEQIRYAITVETDSTARVHFPEGQTFSPLETVEAGETDSTILANGRLKLMKMYALTQFDSGQYLLPAQRIEINGKAFFTDSLLVDVATVPVDTTKQKMYDIKPLMSVEKSNSALWTALLVILGLLILGGFLVYWFVFRKKPLTQEEKEALLPPYDRALLELKKLENSKYLIQSEYKKYYTELTDIVRLYLEDEVHVTAMESTTDELISKLEMLKDAGQLHLEPETLNQFKNILQTADLVKFAKSKPSTQVAEDDRNKIEQIVIKTREALPEPTEEELMEQEAYREELERKKRKKKMYYAAAALSFLIAATASFLISYYGFTNVKDTLLGNPTKSLLEGEWVNSSYGFPPVIVETPEVLTRQEVKLPEELQGTIKEVHAFMYRNPEALFTVGVTSTLLNAKDQKTDFGGAIEQIISNFEKNGAKNIITKQEEFTTVSGISGVKVFGSGEFKVPESDDLIGGSYTILLFGGDGFQQQVILTWQRNDTYAEKIVDRILRTVEVKNNV